MNLINYGERFFDELEIAKYRRKEVSVDVELNQISMSSVGDRALTVIRGIKDKKIGIFIVDSDDEGEIKRGIEQAAKNAMANERDEKWVELPKEQKYNAPEIESNYEIKDASPDFFVNLLNDAIKDVKARDERAMVAGGAAGGSWLEMRILNSHGIDIMQEFGSTFMYLYVAGRMGNSVTPGIIDFDVRRDMNLDKNFIVSSILEKLKYAYTMKKSNKTEGNVIIEPLALEELLYFTLIPAINGERKVKNTTPLSDKVGQKILDEKITIYDDPWHPMSTNPIIADDEGVAARVNKIFEKGIFKGFLWDNYWGNISGEGSTGNGTRIFSTGGIGIGVHNLVIEGGNKEKEELIGEIKDGFLISGFQGAHSSNPDTGDFSVVANPAFKIEDGELVGSTVFMLSGNVYSLLGNVADISREQRKIVVMGNGVMPDMLFENLKIAPVSR